MISRPRRNRDALFMPTRGQSNPPPLHRKDGQLTRHVHKVPSTAARNNPARLQRPKLLPPIAAHSKGFVPDQDTPQPFAR